MNRDLRHGGIWLLVTKEVLNSGNRFDVASSTGDITASDIKILTNPVRSDLSVQLTRPL
ncbi:MAG: hypothetical protein U0T81_05800 [Saprospiraceae bacterium]